MFIESAVYGYDIYKQILLSNIPLLSSLPEVKFGDEKTISRDTCCENEQVLTLCLKHLGTRVCVNNLDVHITSLYDLMKISIPRSYAEVD